jgi:hypothetical protein
MVTICNLGLLFFFKENLAIVFIYSYEILFGDINNYRVVQKWHCVFKSGCEFL